MCDDLDYDDAEYDFECSQANELCMTVEEYREYLRDKNQEIAESFANWQDARSL